MTGSTSNPYEFIEVDENAVKAFEANPLNIIGVNSAANCPAALPNTTTSQISTVQSQNGTSVATVAAGINLSTQSYTVPTKQTLYVDGFLGTVEVKSGATLKGVGSVGPLTVDAGGTVAPGHSPGCLTSSDLNMSGSYSADIAGTTACTGYDQLKTAGSITLKGTLAIKLASGYTPKAGQSFEIINNLGTDPVSGTFTNLPEGATLSSSGTTFQITYKGGTGNDIVLTVPALDPASANNQAISTHPKKPANPRTVQIIEIIAAILVVLAAAGGGFILWRRRQPTPKTNLDATPPPPAK